VSRLFYEASGNLGLLLRPRSAHVETDRPHMSSRTLKYTTGLRFGTCGTTTARGGPA